MNKYAVAIISLIDNENKVYIVNANNAPDAMIEALKQFNPDDYDYNAWVTSLPCEIDKIKFHSFNTEIGISDPVLIN